MKHNQLKIENCKILNEREIYSGFSERPFEYLAIEKRFSPLLFSEQQSTEFHLFLWDYNQHRYRSVETICISADLMFDNYDEIHDKVVENYKKRKQEELKKLGVHPGQIAYYE